MKEETCSIDGTGCGSTKIDGIIDYEKHWCAAYKTDITTLGWYEKLSTPSLELIIKSGVAKNARILNVGAGSTTLIDNLIEKGYTNIIANDISSCALGNIKARIINGKNTNDPQEENISKVEFITDDIINPKLLDKIKKVDLWNDRAVLHFFTKVKEQKAYFNLLNNKVKSGGFVILAEFNLQGATKCSGLDVKRYDSKMLQESLGKEYTLLEEFNYDYEMPSGEIRKYIYTLFQRI